MFGFFRKRRAIKSFVRDMGPALRREFGTKPHYTPEEVQKVANRNPSLTDYLPYAMCMFAAPAAFHAMYPDSGEHSYEGMRKEIGASHFGGDSSFSVETAIEAGESSSDSGSWSGDSGGDSGGGGGDSGCGGGGCGGGGD